MDHCGESCNGKNSLEKKSTTDPDPTASIGAMSEGTNLIRDDSEMQKIIDGDAHFHRLGWKSLTIILIINAIALGSLSLPSAFASLGMVAGVLVCVGIGFIAIYTSLVIGQVKLKFPAVAHYVDIGRLMMGEFGAILVGFMFVSGAILVIGSHCLTGAIALAAITQSSICSIVFAAISAILLLLLAIPPSFAELAFLAYIDFASIILAICVTIIATGIQTKSMDANTANAWSAWPKPDLTLSEAFVSVSSIVFSYSFAVAQPSVMHEMHTPKDFKKAIWALGLTEIVVYTLTGGIIYWNVGQDVQSPALLSGGATISRIVFGIALPVIFISGSISTTVLCRYIHGHIYKDSVVQYINTKKGWATWLGAVTIITLAAWLIAELIPFFSELLSLVGSLFISGFSFYLPPVMWFVLLKEGPWYDRENIQSAVWNGIVFLIGITVLGCGTYASIVGMASIALHLMMNIKLTIFFRSRSLTRALLGDHFHVPSNRGNFILSEFRVSLRARNE
jgi:hypothetical protein